MSRYSPTVRPEYFGTTGRELADALGQVVAQRRAEQQATDAHRQAEIEAVRGGYRPTGAGGGASAALPASPASRSTPTSMPTSLAGAFDAAGGLNGRAPAHNPMWDGAPRSAAMPSSVFDRSAGGAMPSSVLDRQGGSAFGGDQGDAIAGPWGDEAPQAGAAPAAGGSLAEAMRAGMGAGTPAPAPAPVLSHGGGAPGAFQPALGGFAPSMPAAAGQPGAARPAPGRNAAAPGPASGGAVGAAGSGQYPDLAAAMGGIDDAPIALESGGTLDLYAGERRQLATHTLQQRFALAAAQAERERKAASLRAAGVPEDKIAVALEIPSAAGEMFKPAPTMPVDERVAARVKELQGQGKSLAEANRIAALEHGRTPFTDPITAHQANRLFDVEHPLPSTAEPNKPTEFSNKAALVYPRAAEAFRTLDKFYTSGISPRQGLGRIPVVGNMVMTPDEQSATSAAETVSSAILRLESGAAISEHEVKEYAKQFLPQIGDSDQVRAEKRARLETQLERMRVAAAPTMSRDMPAGATPAPRRFQGKGKPAAPAPAGGARSAGDVDLRVPPHVQSIDEMIRAGKSDTEIRAAMQAGVK